MTHRIDTHTSTVKRSYSRNKVKYGGKTYVNSIGLCSLKTCE